MTQQEAIDFCRERIASYKIPTSINFVDKLPITTGGRVRKYVLR